MKTGLKKILAYILIAVCAFSISACGVGKKEEDYIGMTKTNTITLNEDGSIREIAREDFSGVNFDTSNLKNDIKAEVEEYCTNHGENTVKFLQYKNTADIVRVALDYKSLEDYNRFNQTEYVNDLAANISQDEIVSDLNGNELDISSMDGSKGTLYAFICDGELNLTVNGEILYINSHATVGTDTTSASLDGLGKAIIIYKK